MSLQTTRARSVPAGGGLGAGGPGDWGLRAPRRQPLALRELPAACARRCQMGHPAAWQHPPGDVRWGAQAQAAALGREAPGSHPGPRWGPRGARCLGSRPLRGIAAARVFSVGLPGWTPRPPPRGPRHNPQRRPSLFSMPTSHRPCRSPRPGGLACASEMHAGLASSFPVEYLTLSPGKQAENRLAEWRSCRVSVERLNRTVQKHVYSGRRGCSSRNVPPGELPVGVGRGVLVRPS